MESGETEKILSVKSLCQNTPKSQTYTRTDRQVEPDGTDGIMVIEVMIEAEQLLITALSSRRQTPGADPEGVSRVSGHPPFA